MGTNNNAVYTPTVTILVNSMRDSEMAVCYKEALLIYTLKNCQFMTKKDI